ncbi:hypothetical protein M436DRAFT_80276 [Aureobasidium namibiae CBS 147.97]|uniref:Uncharacterized protein n=1 Tax=Aureobasidium namibiae CBS 147.97 TaxID=1043004 RepID=A0A074WNU3_9PEZI
MAFSASPSPPPMTTRQKARHVAQAGQPRLKYVVDNLNLDSTEADSIEVKEVVRERFNSLCEEAGWMPTDAIRRALMVLTKIDAGWRQRDCEAALFAFVQHLDFVWMNGWVLLGRKKFKAGVLCVWYRPIYSTKSRSIEFCYGSQKTVFKPVDLNDRVDKDKVWLPFTKLFDLPNLSRDKQNLYLVGVFEILQKFTYMRGFLDPNGSEDSALRPASVELPFLPGSGWLKQQRLLMVDTEQDPAVEPRGRLQPKSSSGFSMDTHVESDGAYHPSNSTSAASTTSSIARPRYSAVSIVNSTDPTDSVSTSNSSRTELERMRRQKRKATSSPDGSPTRKQGRPSNAGKHPIKSLYRSHCQRFEWTPSETTLQTIVDLLGAHDVEVSIAEASLLAFVQYVDVVWENDRIFIGSRKVEGAQRYERVWYKTVHRDGIYHGEFSVDAGKQTCSLSVRNAKIEHFSPFFDTLFDMKDLGSANSKQQDVYIAGTYLILLRYPALRRYQRRSSGTGIKLAPRSEEFERPFSPESSQSNAILQAIHPSSSSEPASSIGLQPTPGVQFRQSDSVARILAEVLQEQETHCKITAMIQKSARAFIAEPEPTTSSDALGSPPCAEPSQVSITIPKTLRLPQQPQEQSALGIVHRLLLNAQISSFVETTCDRTQLVMVTNLPANLFRPTNLGFCPVVSFGISPILPSRDYIVKGLEMIALGRVEPRQSTASQQRVAASQERPLPAPVAVMMRAPEKSNGSRITINQARELLHRPRAKIEASGHEKDGGLELFRFGITFTSSAIEQPAIKLDFSTVLSKDTPPVSLTKSQALAALFEFAREDEESQQAK